jgi:DNA primase
MDAVSLLNEHIDMAKLLEHYDFDKVRTDGRMIRSCCKIHGGNNSSAFVVNTENNLWYCHTSTCGGGDAYNLVQLMQSCDFATAVRVVARVMGVDIENLQIVERKSEYINELKRWIKLMRSKMKKQEAPPYHIKSPTREVVKFRSFLPETIEHFGMKFIESMECNKRDGTSYMLKNRLVIPIVQNNVQIGVSLRRTRSSDSPKWSHQPVHIETSNLLYNYDTAKNESKIIVCEGMFDVWAWHEIGTSAVATYGAHITDEQYRLLMKTGADLVFAYDGDKAGREAMSKAKILFKNKANMEFVWFGEGEDAENIPREELMNYYARKSK